MRGILSSVSYGSVRFSNKALKPILTRDFTDKACFCLKNLPQVKENLQEYVADVIQRILTDRNDTIDVDRFNLIPYLYGVRKYDLLKENYRMKREKSLVLDDKQDKEELVLDYSQAHEKDSSEAREKHTIIELYEALDDIKFLLEELNKTDNTFVELISQANKHNWNSFTSNQLVEYVDRVRVFGSPDLYDNIKQLSVYMMFYGIYDLEALVLRLEEEIGGQK